MAVNTTLPLWTYVATSVQPMNLAVERRSAMATRLRPPTLIPRRSATWVGIGAHSSPKPISDVPGVLCPPGTHRPTSRLCWRHRGGLLPRVHTAAEYWPELGLPSLPLRRCVPPRQVGGARQGAEGQFLRTWQVLAWVHRPVPSAYPFTRSVTIRMMRANMATEAARIGDSDGDTEASAAALAPSQAAPALAPYAPSWVDWLIAQVERAPGPPWVAYLVFTGITVTASFGLASLGTPDDALAYAFWGALLPLILWIVHHLAGVAGAAFDAFRPLADATDAEASRLRYGLTVIPARPALAILVFTAVFTPLYWIADPVTSDVVGIHGPALVARFFSETFFGAMLLVLVYQSIRQLRAVGRTHDLARRVDLFNPGPLYAFSSLTARSAIAVALGFTVPTWVAAQQAPGAEGGAWFIGFAVAGAVVGVIVFVVPLLGMRRRIVEEKRRLQAEVGTRIETTMNAVHAAVDAGDLAGAGSVRDALGVLVEERTLVDRLPTFPWRTGTLGAVATAILLPVGLAVFSRLLERVI